MITRSRPPHSASMTPTWRPAICVASQGLASARIVKRSRNRLHMGRATLRNARHKHMSSGELRSSTLLLSSPLLHQDKLSSWSRLRPCDAHRSNTSHELASIRTRQHLARRAAHRHRHGLHDVLATRLNGASRGRQKRVDLRFLARENIVVWGRG